MHAIIMFVMLFTMSLYQTRQTGKYEDYGGSRSNLRHLECQPNAPPAALRGQVGSSM